MGVKIILLSIILMHACADSFEESSGRSYEDDYGSSDDSNPSTYGAPYLGPAPKTNIDCVPPEVYYRNNINRNSSTAHKNPEMSICGVGGFIASRTQGSNKSNKGTLKISDNSAAFLKGLMVTHVMPSLYIFIILISLPLNTLALVTFTCKIREKKPAVIYMSHLACVDLLFTLLLPLKIHYQLNASDWVFGEVMCRVLTAAYYCYMYCSILLMMCISVDRLLAVTLPIASLNWRSARKAMWVCVLVWLLAIAGTVPLLSMRQTVEIKDVGIICHDALIFDDPIVLYYVYLFSILSCLYFFLPLVVTLVSYFTIIYVLRPKSDRLASSSSSSGNRRKAVIMAIAVLVEFVVCFAPTNGILLHHCVCLATQGEGDSSYVAYLLVVCLGSSSVFLDPLLYYFGSSQCRQQIKYVFLCRKAKRVRTPNT